MIKVIVNASPIVGLSKIGKLNLLWKLFDEIYVPKAVFNEVTTNNKTGSEELKAATRESRIQIHTVRDKKLVEKLYGKLHKGELEVIFGGIELKVDFVVLDEIYARNLAADLSLIPLGLIGVLRFAKNDGLIQELKKDLLYLKNNGFWISEKLVNKILIEENEIQ